MAANKGAHKREQTWRPTVFLWLVVFALWLTWSGHYSFDHPLLLGFGFLSACLVTFLCRRMGLVDVEMTPMHLTFRTLRYLPWLSWQVLLSCWDVLKVGLSGEQPTPRVATVVAKQRSSLGLVSYANSITLTPGTLSLDVDAAERTIKVHAFSDKTMGDLQSGEMDRWVRWVEGA